MEILVLLIAISISIALLFLGIFYWNIKNGQFDDTYTPSVRMLFDNKPKSATDVPLPKKAGSPSQIGSSKISKSNKMSEHSEKTI